MKKLILFILVLILTACEKNKTIKYSGFNDLVVGSETINLYKDNSFSIELGLGYRTGQYTIDHDTVYLKYTEPSNWPKIFLLKAEKFESVHYHQNIIIRRTDPNKSR